MRAGCDPAHVFLALVGVGEECNVTNGGESALSALRTFAELRFGRKLRFECSMLQTPYDDEEGKLSYRDVTCDEDRDFASLWTREWLLTDFELKMRC